MNGFCESASRALLAAPFEGVLSDLRPERLVCEQADASLSELISARRRQNLVIRLPAQLLDNQICPDHRNPESGRLMRLMRHARCKAGRNDHNARQLEPRP